MKIHAILSTERYDLRCRTYDGGYDAELENDWDEHQRCFVFDLSALK